MRELDGLTWILRLTITNEAGDSSLDQQFEISFIDACWLAKLTPAVFSSTVYEFNLFEDMAIVSFEAMKYNLDQCGTTTYTINYAGGETPQILNKAWIAGTTIGFTGLDDRKFLGSHLFTFTSHNGRFEMIESPKFAVVMKDPCFEASILSNAVLPDVVGATNGDLESSVTITGLVDSVT